MYVEDMDMNTSFAQEAKYKKDKMQNTTKYFEVLLNATPGTVVLCIYETSGISRNKKQNTQCWTISSSTNEYKQKTQIQIRVALDYLQHGNIKIKRYYRYHVWSLYVRYVYVQQPASGTGIRCWVVPLSFTICERPHAYCKPLS